MFRLRTGIPRDATAIIVGHRGDSRVSMMLGSTANYVLHHTTRPVVIVRGDEAVVPKRVVVGVDEHDLDEEHGAENESTRAVRWAYQLAGVEEVRVVHAWFLPALAVGMFGTVAAELDTMDAAAQAIVDRVLASAGAPPEHLTVIGEAVDVTGWLGGYNFQWAWSSGWAAGTAIAARR